MRGHERKLLRHWAFKVCFRIPFETFFLNAVNPRVENIKTKKRGLRSCPFPSKTPTFSLIKPWGHWPRRVTHLHQGKGYLSFRETPAKWGKPQIFYLIRNLVLLSVPPPSLIQNLNFHLGAKQWGKAAPRGGVCKGNPSLFTPGMHFARDSPYIPYPSYSCTPTVKAEGKLQEHHVHPSQSWDATAPWLRPFLEWGEEHLVKTVYLSGFLPEQTLLFGPWILALTALHASHPHCLRMWAQKSSSKEFHCSPPA